MEKMNNIAKQITEMTLSALIGVEESINEIARINLNNYVDSLIRLKNANQDPGLIGGSRILHRIKQSADIGITASEGIEGSAGIQLKLLLGANIAGSREIQTCARIGVELESQSVGMPDFSKIEKMTVAELQEFKKIVNKKLVNNDETE